MKTSRTSTGATLAFFASLSLLVACEGGQAVVVKTPADTKPVDVKKPDVTPPAPSVDVLGPKPTLGASKPFASPAVDMFKTKSGMNVWLVERHGLPLVAATLVVSGGSSVDPTDKPGLMHITTDMLDEGAGKRSAVELSSAVNDLGATLSLSTSVDATVVSLSVLKNNFSAAFGIFADVVSRPRFEDKEWKRVSDLWKNDLKSRADEPRAVSRVVNAAVLFGPGTPYGHPADGLLSGAENIDLASVKKFYAEQFRPDHAVLVVAGDITRAEIEAAIETQLGSWKAPAAKGRPFIAAPVPAPRPASARPKLVLVDRADAPQSVIAAVREGVAAADKDAPLLDLINTVLGGSFTSRLNQNLREEHHWAYGAGSAFQESRAMGAFTASASVETEATGPALKEMINELQKMAASGPTAAELDKAKAQDAAELTQIYETVSGTSRRLASLARLGLSPSFDLDSSRSRRDAKLEDAIALSKKHVEPSAATIVVVGPRAVVWPVLTSLGLGEPEIWSAEGKPVDANAAVKDAKAAPKDAKAAPQNTKKDTKKDTKRVIPAPQKPKSK